MLEQQGPAMEEAAQTLRGAGKQAWVFCRRPDPPPPQLTTSSPRGEGTAWGEKPRPGCALQAEPEMFQRQ